MTETETKRKNRDRDRQRQTETDRDKPRQTFFSSSENQNFNQGPIFLTKKNKKNQSHVIKFLLLHMFGLVLCTMI